MLQEEAKAAIVDLWPAWVKSHEIEGKPNGHQALMFYGWVRTHHPNLLSFKSSGDKWQVVHGWMLSRELVVD